MLFATHGSFDIDNAEQSTLELNRQSLENLTAREIAMMDLGQARLAILSACETGLNDIADYADEHLGLPSAFLIAGANAVIASRWNVDDLATALMIGRLHVNLFTQRMGNSEALRAAQEWLRELTAKQARELLKSAEYALTTIGSTSRTSVGDVKGALLSLYNEGTTDRPFANPYYWAAFFCFGAPGSGRLTRQSHE
jgi:CHAT domain-containing protein